MCHVKCGQCGATLNVHGAPVALPAGCHTTVNLSREQRDAAVLALLGLLARIEERLASMYRHPADVEVYRDARAAYDALCPRAPYRPPSAVDGRQFVAPE